MIIKYNGDIKGAQLWRTGRMREMRKFKTMVSSVLVAYCATSTLGCGKQITQDEHDEWQRIADALEDFVYGEEEDEKESEVD